MSWLHNFSMGGPNQKVRLNGRKLPIESKFFYFPSALEHGLPWGKQGVPDFLKDILYGGTLEPWVVVGLLEACRSGLGTGASVRAFLSRASRDVTAESAVQALEEEARHLELPRAALLTRVGSTLHGHVPYSRDLVLTMVVLAKSTRYSFVAAKRPSLQAITGREGMKFNIPLNPLLAGVQETDDES